MLALALLALVASVLAAEAFGAEADPGGEATPAMEEEPGSETDLAPAGPVSTSAEGDKPPAPETDPRAAEELPHEELDRGGAEELLSGAFGEVVETVAEAPGEGEDVDRYLSDTAAVVEDPLSGATGLLESILPLRAETEDGDRAPVSLELTPREGDLTPENPLAPVEIPGDLGEGIDIPGAGIEVHLEGARRGRLPRWSTPRPPSTRTSPPTPISPSPRPRSGSRR